MLSLNKQFRCTCLACSPLHRLLAKQVLAIYCLVSAKDSMILLFENVILKRSRTSQGQASRPILTEYQGIILWKVKMATHLIVITSPASRHQKRLSCERSDQKNFATASFS